ncbi:MAG: hypothetical protein EOP81_12115 [Variovorax sp.]|nr:MAG: hypothetical protein EOP81_12115 [Variovorax sp.]
MSAPSHHGFSLTRRIAAKADAVWNVILTPNRHWAAAFGEGTRVETDWAEGSPILWLDDEGHIGASGRVEELRTGQSLRLRYHDMAARDAGAALGTYTETFILVSDPPGHTELRVQIDATPHMDNAAHRALWDAALDRIQAQAEMSD